jgi:hypothetical protein
MLGQSHPGYSFSCCLKGSVVFPLGEGKKEYDFSVEERNVLLGCVGIGPNNS